MTGVTIMRMEEGLDTGPVAALATEPLLADDTAGTLAKRLAPLGARLLDGDERIVATETADLSALTEPEIEEIVKKHIRGASVVPA